MSSKRAEVGFFTVMRKDVIPFLSDCSMRTKDDIQELEYREVCAVVSVITESVLRAFFKVKYLQGERSQINAPMNHVPPPVLPDQIFLMRPRELLRTVKTQEDLLLSLGKEADIFILGNKI